MKNSFFVVFIAVNLIQTFVYSQENFEKITIYDDWPVTVISNEHRQALNSGDFSINFVPIGTTWDHRIITYFFQNGTTDINGDNEKQAIRDGFSFWAAETDLFFLEVCSAEEADIVFLWGVGNHGDAAPFDGPGGVLAHCLGGPPPNVFGDEAGDIHFDDDETWTLDFRPNMNQPIDLVTVAAHEIGHALGLDHTTVTGSLMLNNYTGSHRFLGNDDRAGIRSLYGNKGQNNPITGSSVICTSENYTLNETVPETVINWSISPSSAGTISGNGTSITVNRNIAYTGNAILTATITSDCGSTNITKNISLGLSISISWQGPGPYGQLDVDVNGGSAPFKFYKNGTLIYTSSSPFNNTIPFGCDGGALKVEANTSCGVSSVTELIPSGCASFYSMYPNPTSETLIVSRTTDKVSDGLTDVGRSTHTYILYDFNGNLVSEGKLSEHETVIDVSKLRKGRYVLKIILSKENDESHHILVR